MPKLHLVGSLYNIHTECLLSAQRLRLMRHGLKTINFSKLMLLRHSYTKSKGRQNVLTLRKTIYNKISNLPSQRNAPSYQPVNPV